MAKNTIYKHDIMADIWDLTPSGDRAHLDTREWRAESTVYAGKDADQQHCIDGVQPASMENPEHNASARRKCICLRKCFCVKTAWVFATIKRHGCCAKSWKPLNLCNAIIHLIVTIVCWVLRPWIRHSRNTVKELRVLCSDEGAWYIWKTDGLPVVCDAMRFFVFTFLVIISTLLAISFSYTNSVFVADINSELVIIELTSTQHMQLSNYDETGEDMPINKCLPVYFEDQSSELPSVYKTWQNEDREAWSSRVEAFMTQNSIPCSCPMLYGSRACLLTVMENHSNGSLTFWHFANPVHRKQTANITTIKEKSKLFDKISTSLAARGFYRGLVYANRTYDYVLQTHDVSVNVPGGVWIGVTNTMARVRTWKHDTNLDSQQTSSPILAIGEEDGVLYAKLGGEVACCAQHCMDLMSGNADVYKELHTKRFQ